jgi:invasion protein IalB
MLACFHHSEPRVSTILRSHFMRHKTAKARRMAHAERPRPFSLRLAGGSARAIWASKRISGRAEAMTKPGLFGAVAALCCASLATVPPAAAQGVVRGNFSDWELRCEQQQGKEEQCILYQNVADERDANINVVVVVLRIAEGGTDGKPVVRKPVLRVIAPLGVLLPRGLGLRIESATEKDKDGKPVVKDIGSTGFVKCVPSGCVAEVEIDERLDRELKNGSTATFIIFDRPNEGRGLPLALVGYEKGMAALK